LFGVWRLFFTSWGRERVKKGLRGDSPACWLARLRAAPGVDGANRSYGNPMDRAKTAYLG
jgi:hypothetical protein